MVEAICACGQKQEAAEDNLAEISPCGCGRGMCAVSAEQLPEGAGAGDFDARLVITQGPANVGQQILLGGCLDIEIGKLAERHVCLVGPKVSRLHARLKRVDFGPSRWTIVDNNSTNGVLVNGEKISEKELENNDLITLGDYELRFENVFEEEAQILQEAAPATAMPRKRSRVASSAGDTQILEEMRRLQDRQSSWLTGIALLVVSLLAFLGSQMAGGSGANKEMQSAEFLTILVGILLVHEAGHFVAMRIFHYRNVRMFFIPFLGAAVSGRSYSAPGWKKVVVSLMGPVPGILIGGAVGLIGISAHEPLLIKIGLLALILNGFNLLPVLPLDGGRIMQTLLFSRHYLLDTGFRLIAAAALILFGVMGHGEQVLLVVGIAMLVSLPLAIAQGKIAQEMRGEGWAAEAGDDIPDDVALTIIQRLRGNSVVGKSKRPRTIATSALRVYELLAARPPEWAAAGGFFVLYAGSIGAACALPILIIVANRARMQEFSQNPAEQFVSINSQPAAGAGMAQINSSQGQASPSAGRGRYPLPQGLIARVGAGGAPMTMADAIPWPHQTIVANYNSTNDADSAFASAAPMVATGEVLEKFGQTLFACFPTGDKSAESRWTNQLQSNAKEIRTDTERGVTAISFEFTAASEILAREMETQCRVYFVVPHDLHLIPPWMPNDARSAAQQTKDRLARDTYLKILQTRTSRDAMSEQMSKAMFQAAMRRDRDQVRIISQQLMDRRMQLRQQAIAAMADVKDGSVDTELVKDYQALPAPKVTDRGIEDTTSPVWQTLGERMGQFSAASGAERFSTQFGLALREGPAVHTDYIHFVDPPSGAPALVDWLQRCRCTGIKFAVRIIPERQPTRGGAGIFLP